MHNENTLILLPSSYAKEAYIERTSLYSIIDTANIKTISSFYYTLRLQLIFSLEERYIERYEALYILKNSIEIYNKKNKGNIFYSIPPRIDFINELYSFYDEVSLMYAYKNEEEINSFFISETSKAFISIINEYKNIIKKENLIDDNALYINLISLLKNKDSIFDNLLQYSKIELHGFDIINIRYSILIQTLAKYYSIDVKQKLPYCPDIIYSIEESYKTYPPIGRDIFTIEKSEYASKADNLFLRNSKENTDKSILQNIKFMASFGVLNEIDNICRYIESLISSGVPSYSIAILINDTEKYYTPLIKACQKMNIAFLERRGEPLWNMPFIPILASFFSVRKETIRGYEIDIDILSKILSSSYISVENIESETIRNILFERDKLNLYSIMEEKKLIKKLERISEENEYFNEAVAILSFINEIKLLASSENLKTSSDRFLSLLRYIKIADTIKLNEYTFERDNNALALFIECIKSIGVGSILYFENKKPSEDFLMLLNDSIRKAYMPLYAENERGITISTFYDARGHNYEYIFIPGMNKNFLQNRVSSFILASNIRENINRHFRECIILSDKENISISDCLFLNIIMSSLSRKGSIYLSFQYKNEKGDIDIPSVYIEDLFYKKTQKMFLFENLKEDGLIYEKEYIHSYENAVNEEEGKLSLFYERKGISMFVSKDIAEKVDSVYKRQLANISYDIEYDADEKEKDNVLYLMKRYLSKPISVSDLETILLCLERFMYEKIFEEKEIQINEIGINKIDKGVIYHGVLEKFFNTVKNDYGIILFKKANAKKYFSLASNSIKLILKDSYVLYDESLFDIDIINEEILYFMKVFIERETERFENYSLYAPHLFEQKFENYKLCSEGDLSFILNGRIDRIDLHYEDENYKNINGLRIVDYKSTIKDLGEKNIGEHTQIMLYLKYAMEKENYKTDNISIAYSSYDIYRINTNTYFSEYNNKDIIMSSLNEIENKAKTVLAKIQKGIIEYKGSKDACIECPKKAICSKAYGIEE